MGALNAKNAVIINQDIEHILSLKNTRDVLKRRLEIAQNELDKSEAEIIDLIQIGCKVVTTYDVSLKEEVRRSVPWKSVVANILGHEKTEQILKEAVPTVTVKLLIKDK